jgi:serine/threonine protein kinase
MVTSRSVAIKFLHPELVDNAELSQRFFQEAQAVNRIRHPNIVDVLDAGVSDLGPYIVMEHLDGESVGTALARFGRFEVDAVVGTAIPVLEALDAAHRAGIIHRDLKPENVFIAFDASKGVAVVRLLDFGIAKVLDSDGQMPRTRTGVVFGTPDYLSPEQATGESVDRRAQRFVRRGRADVRAAHGDAAVPGGDGGRDGVQGRAHRGADDQRGRGSTLIRASRRPCSACSRKIRRRASRRRATSRASSSGSCLT